MKTITLYSNNKYDLGCPAGSIVHADNRWNSIDSDDSRIVHPREKPASQTLWPTHPNLESESASYIFNSAGINCTYANSKNQPDLVRLIDVGSPPSWTDIASAAERFFDGKPYILFSSQEPCTQLQELKDQYPNAFVMDITYGSSVYDRHLPFPSFFSRMLNPFFNTVIGYHTINLAHTDFKKYIYNNLKFRNDQCKAITQYMLCKHNLLDRGIVTYNRDKGSLSRSMLPPDEDNHIIHSFEDQVMNANLPSIDTSMYSVEDFTDWFHRHNSKGLNPDGGFSAKKRYHPIFIYNDTFFTMVNESGSSTLQCTVFSEKTLYPLMNGHPLIVNQQMQGQVYKHMTELGFELYDEILDYCSFDENRWLLESIHNCINNIENFDKGRYDKNLEHTIKKSRHNKANFLNTNSVLWTTLRQLMQTHLEKYFDACN